MRVISHPFVLWTYLQALICLFIGTGIRSSQILIPVSLLIASLPNTTLAQTASFATSDTMSFMEQDTTTLSQPVCPHASGPLYFATLLAGGSGPYMSRTLFTLFNGSEVDVEGELSIETTGGDFDSVQLVHSCSDSNNIPHDCSFDLIGNRASFRLAVGTVLTMTLGSGGPLWTGWAKLKGDMCSGSVLQIAETREDSSYLILSNLVAEIELFPTHGSRKHAFPVTQYLTGKGVDFWSAYAIVNISSTTAEVQLKGLEDEPFTLDLAPGERIARYTQGSVTATFPAGGGGWATIESSQPLAVTFVKTRNWLPFLGIPTVEYRERP